MKLGTAQEEVDTGLLLHVRHYIQFAFSNVTIYSPSRVADVLVLPIVLLKDFTYRIYIIDKHEECKKDFIMSREDLDEKIIDSLTGFPAKTGNDFASSFFGKGKKEYMC